MNYNNSLVALFLSAHAGKECVALHAIILLINYTIYRVSRQVSFGS